MKNELYSKIGQFCRICGIEKMIEEAGGIIVGFSGGADSVFLLSYLYDILPEEKVLCAVHLNHMLRGDEACRDERFCLDFCRARRIDFVSEKADVYFISQSEKKGIEECARELRYNLFDKCRKRVAEEKGISEEKILIATAHNADDNMETVIFNAARGSGAAGLCGIPPIRDEKYIRPILCLSSMEIRDYLGENKIDFVFDSTNAENDYARNKIRHKVVPVLKDINPAAQNAFLRLSQSLRSDEDYFEKVVEDILYAEGRKAGTLEVSKIKDAHPSVMSRVIRRLYCEVCPEGNISALNVSDVEKMITEGRNGDLDLPGKITVRISDSLKFFKGGVPKNEETPFYSTELKEGLNCFDSLGFVLSVSGIKENCDGNSSENQGIRKNEENNFEINSNVYNSLIYTALNNDKIKSTLFVRNRRESDVYRIGGHHKKVKKLFCDKKISIEMRDKIPLVCDGDGILWIPGFPPRDGCQYKGEGRKLTVGYYYFDKEKSNG